jgi:hypothetical protein
VSGMMIACQGCGLEAYREFDGSPVCQACARQTFVCACTGAPCHGAAGIPGYPGADDHSACAPLIGRCNGDGGRIPLGKGYEGKSWRDRPKGGSGQVVRTPIHHSVSVDGGVRLAGRPPGEI